MTRAALSAADWVFCLLVAPSISLSPTLTARAVRVGRVTTATDAAVGVVLATAVGGDEGGHLLGVDAAGDLDVARRLLEVGPALPDVAPQLLLVSAWLDAERLCTVAAVLRSTNRVASRGQDEALRFQRGREGQERAIRLVPSFNTMVSTFSRPAINTHDIRRIVGVDVNLLLGVGGHSSGADGDGQREDVGETHREWQRKKKKIQRRGVAEHSSGGSARCSLYSDSKRETESTHTARILPRPIPFPSPYTICGARTEKGHNRPSVHRDAV